MTKEHRFGGPWTQDKLGRLAKYLHAYMTIFKQNIKARYFRTYYVDAFAGTGFRTPKSRTEATLFDDSEGQEFQKGSAVVALETDPPFDHYIFVDSNPEHVEELRRLENEYPRRDIAVERDDANDFIARWCANTDWSKNRAVVFLDPYGAQIEWATIECIADTRAIDLWWLFPLGQAVNRMLTKRQPEDGWAIRLDRIFGTDKWREAFYGPSGQKGLFDEDPEVEKQADFDSIGGFIISQLESVFAKVAQKPLPLYNSKNIPLFLFCFAAGNPKGAPTAVKIANDILRS